MSQRTELGELPLFNDPDTYRPPKMLYGKTKDRQPSWNYDKKRKSMFDFIVEEDKK